MIIDRLVTLFDFKVDKKALKEYHDRVASIQRLTKRLGETTKYVAADIKKSISGNAQAQRTLNREITNYTAKIRAAEVAMHGKHSAARASYQKEINSLLKLRKEKQKQLDLLKRVAESHKAFGRVASRENDKATLAAKKYKNQILQNKIAIRGLATETRRAFRGITHRISRTASVLIRFRNLMGITIAGAIGFNEAKNITRVGLDDEKRRLALKHFGATKGESAEQAKARVKETEQWIAQVALQTPLGIADTTDLFVNFEQRGLEANKILKGVIDSTFKYGGAIEDLQRAMRQLGQAWSNNKLTAQDMNAATQARLPLMKALIAVTGDATKTEQENIAHILELRKKGLIGRDILRDVFKWFAEDSKDSAEELAKSTTGQLNRLGDFLFLFRRMVNDEGYFATFAAVIKEINDELVIMLETGKLKEYAKAVSDFMAGSLRDLWEWAKRVAIEIKEGTHWTQRFANIFGGLGNMLKIIVGIGLVAWLSPLIHLLVIAIPLLTKMTGGFGKLSLIVYAVYTAFKLLVNNWDWIKKHAGKIAAGIGLISAALLVLTARTKGLTLATALSGITGSARILKGVLAGMLGPIGLLATGVLAIASNWDAVTAATERWGKKLKEEYTVVRWLAKLPEAIGESFAKDSTISDFAERGLLSKQDVRDYMFDKVSAETLTAKAQKNQASQTLQTINVKIDAKGADAHEVFDVFNRELKGQTARETSNKIGR